MNVLGIDGCKGGWCMVQIADDDLKIDVIPSFHEIMEDHGKANVLLVDIPIGLGTQEIPRDLEYVARKKLAPKRQSSLFIPPVRDAIAAADYASAKEINQKVTGKKISIQSWNISARIREVDHYLLNNPTRSSQIHEAHPEICFKSLNSGRDLQYRKNAPEKRGIEERIDILRRYEVRAPVVVAQFSENFSSKLVRMDDMVDALCLAVTAKLGLLHGFQQIAGSHSRDAKGVEMSLHYYDPTIDEYK